jgi:hypothetical protein
MAATSFNWHRFLPGLRLLASVRRRPHPVINTTIRSGTNDVHLALFEFLRNRNFDANDLFANRTGSKKPAFMQNNFGTAIGASV